MLPYLLFAYREVPQESTGFSPFELLYGRNVRGPLDVLKEIWEASPRISEGVISHVMEMRERMSETMEIAHTNLATAQAKQKRWYDSKARAREFKEGDQVLVLLPSNSNKLQAEWQGPYEVTKKVGPVNYQVKMSDKKKKLRLFHVNMLRRWYTPADTSYWAAGESDEEDTEAEWERQMEIPHWTMEPEGAGVKDVNINPSLPSPQQVELRDLLAEFQGVFRDTPGRTSVIKHHIHVEGEKPIRQRPYRLPHSQNNGGQAGVTENGRDEGDRAIVQCMGITHCRSPKERWYHSTLCRLSQTQQRLTV